MSEENSQHSFENETKKIPEEFTKVMKDFVEDIRTTFPEYNPLIKKWWKEESDYSYIEDLEERKIAFEKVQEKCFKILFNFCQKKLPPRFFDILYQTEDIFKEDSEIDTEFLPHIHFKSIWNCEITDKTKETIWKYLQLILFSIIGTINNKDAFGDTAKLFESINADEFKSKLEETLLHMQNIFDTPTNTENAESFGSGIHSAGINMDNIPNANDIHEHITGMLDGKLGKLAREIAEEAASSFNVDMENVTDMKDIFNNLVKDPTKLMGLVKTVGDKLDTKMKAGDIKESELIAEATEIMNKMKNMPGMDNIQTLLRQMGMNGMAGMGGLGGNGAKVNVAGMEASLNNKMKLAKTKERIRAKAEANQKAKMEQQLMEQLKQQSNPSQSAISEEELIKIFSTGEKVERTPRVTSTNDNKKKKKNKK
jgi:hypothetical protein